MDVLRYTYATLTIQPTIARQGTSVSTKIGLISDVHATAGPVREALAVFQKQGVDRVFCGGDIAGYGTELDQTVDLLIRSGCETIMGNHDLWYLNNPADGKIESVVAFLEKLPLWLQRGRGLIVLVIMFSGMRCVFDCVFSCS